MSPQELSESLKTNLTWTEVACQAQNITKVPQAECLRSTSHQGARIGWCYAYTAADLLSVAAGTPVKDPISALDMGTTYINANATDLSMAAAHINELGGFVYFNGRMTDSEAKSHSGIHPLQRKGGYSEIAMTLYLGQNRVCQESKAHSMVKHPVDDKMTFEEHTQVMDLTDDETASYIEKIIEKRITGQNLAAQKNSKRECFQTQDINITPDLVGAINQDASLKLKQSLDKSCKNAPGFKKNLEVQHDENDDHTKFLPRIKQLLAKGQPAGFSYDYCRLAWFPKNESCAHESSVAGQKFDTKTGTCKILVRNSHGPNCNITKGLDVECDLKTPGYFWVDENLLNSKAIDMTWIDEKK
jgi:hypothetical protein